MAIVRRAETMAAPPPRAAAGWWRLSPARREALQGVGLLVPTMVLLVGLVLYPFLYSIWLGFTDKAVG